MIDLLIKGATLSNGKTVDIGIADGKFVEPGKARQEVDASGLMAISGLVDLHTHLREPGFESSETIESGSKAAALGGFTAVHAMPNTSPVADTAGVVEQVYQRGLDAGYVAVQPIGAVTVGLEGLQLAEMGAMVHSRANVRVFSDDGKCVADPLIMRRALEYAKTFDAVIAQHAQEPKLTDNAQMNEGVVSSELGLPGWPAVAEEAIIARDVLLANQVGARLHICHVSTAGSVDIIRWAKAKGIRVTCEVTPHHLLLSDELARGYDPVFKVNPPLRTSNDIEALREGLVDGTIDVVATDHAPHPNESKECEWSSAAFGMLGLEAVASVVQSVLIDSGRSNWERFEQVLSRMPAHISGLKSQGVPIAIGNSANLTLIDPTAQRSGSEQHSKSANNPYANMTLQGSVIHTIFQGVPTVLNQQLQQLKVN